MCAWLALRCALRRSPFNRAAAAAELIADCCPHAALAALTLRIRRFGVRSLPRRRSHPPHSCRHRPTALPHCRSRPPALRPSAGARVSERRRATGGPQRARARGVRMCASQCVRASQVRACVRACVSSMDLARSETSRARVQRATRGARRLRIRDSGLSNPTSEGVPFGVPPRTACRGCRVPRARPLRPAAPQARLRVQSIKDSLRGVQQKMSEYTVRSESPRSQQRVALSFARARAALI